MKVTSGLALACLPALACGRSPSGSVASARREARVAWAARSGTWGSPDTAPAIGPDGTIYASGSLAAKGDPEFPRAPAHARRACLHAFDAGGRKLRTLRGSLIGGGEHRFQLWIRMAPWGTAYAVDSAGGLYGMFPDGTQQFRAVGRSLLGPPAIADNGRLFVGSGRGVWGFDLQAADDSAAFSFAERHYVAAPVLGPDGTLYVPTSYGGRLYALDAGGAERWVTRAALSTPVLDDQGSLYCAERRALTALDGAGQRRWEYQAEDDLSPPVLSPDGTLVVIGAAGLVQAVGTDGQRVWSFPLETASYSRPGVGPDGTVYASDRNGRVYAIEPGGTARWTLKLKQPCGTPAAAADGTVYIDCSDGRLYAIAPP